MAKQNTRRAKRDIEENDDQGNQQQNNQQLPRNKAYKIRSNYLYQLMLQANITTQAS